MIILALRHHLNQTTPHKWKRHTNPFENTIYTTVDHRNIYIIQHDSILIISVENNNDNPCRETTTIDLLDTNFLTKIHQVIGT